MEKECQHLVGVSRFVKCANKVSALPLRENVQNALEDVWTVSPLRVFPASNAIHFIIWLIEDNASRFKSKEGPVCRASSEIKMVFAKTNAISFEDLSLQDKVLTKIKSS